MAIPLASALIPVLTAWLEATPGLRAEADTAKFRPAMLGEMKLKLETLELSIDKGNTPAKLPGNNTFAFSE